MRTFMAIKTPFEVSQEISKIQEKLKKEGFYGSWPVASNIHMTLFFFGEISSQKAKKISTLMDDVVKNFAPFSLEINKIGVFPPHGLPRVVWIGCEKDKEIQKLYTNLNVSLKSVGFEFDERFTPHVTAGRIKGVPKKWREKIFDIEFKPVKFECDTVELLSSKLTPKGAVYTLVHRSELGGLKR